MKVQTLIDQLLADYSPDTELAVAYWDKETVASYAGRENLTEDEWLKVVDTYEDGEWGWQGWAADTFSDIIDES
jgi:hypothetical protein